MEIVKRNGSRELLRLDKIVTRIRKQCDGLDMRFVDYNKVAITVFNGLFEGATSRQIDDLAAKSANSLTAHHPDYARLAARIAVSCLHKDTDKSFYKTSKKLLEAGRVTELYFDTVTRYKSQIEELIDYDRDFDFDYFGFRTLENAYLLRVKDLVVERPQHFWMRVAIGIWGGWAAEYVSNHRVSEPDQIQNLISQEWQSIYETYSYMSQKYFTHATPTLFNAGTPLAQLASCFLLTTEDSIEGIYRHTLSDIAAISKLAGGIGVDITNVRAKGAHIKGTNGESTGVVPMLRVFNDTARYVNQGGKRPGSIAVYIEPWHADVEDVLELRRDEGKEELRARDLFYAIWSNDLFIKQVQDDGYWYLFSPDEAPGLHDIYGDEFETLYWQYVDQGIYRKKLKANDLWLKIIEAQQETGLPYMLHKDAINQKSNQKNVGVIKSSNLCVAPETMILTSSGYHEVKELENETVSVWNGREYSEVTILKTGVNQPLIEVQFSNGQAIDCTPYHKFYVQNGYNQGRGVNKLVIEEKRANQLTIGDKIIKTKYPVIEFEEDFPDAYTQGAFSGDGCRYKDKNHIDLYGEKMLLVDRLVGNFVGTFSESQDRQRFSVSDWYDKFEVPMHYSIKSRLDWLAGLADTDGTIALNGTTPALQISSVHKDFLLNVQLMLQTLGVNSKVTKAVDAGMKSLPDGRGGYAMFHCQEAYRLLVGADGLFNLRQLGFYTNRLILPQNAPNRNAEQFVKVTGIVDNGRTDDTYCATEPKRNRLIFNGIETGNCTEIVEYTSADETAVCNLASIVLSKFVFQLVPGTRYHFDFDALYSAVRTVTRNLNRVIDVTYYPTKETRTSNLRHRPIGIGVQALADVFAKMKIAFDSPEAKQLNRDIFECIYFAALSESHALALDYGPYETFAGSPLSQGIFQFDMWEDRKVQQVNGKMVITERSPVKLGNKWNWEELRAKIVNDGVYNSLLLAPMPTASTAQIMGSNEAFEPYTRNIYLRKVDAGEFTVINKHLVAELVELNLWNDTVRMKLIDGQGSVQAIEAIPMEIRERYKTAFELKQRDIIEMATDRGKFICQSQSMNLFFANPNYAKLSSAQIYGWLLGLKTGVYYTRTASVVERDKSLGVDISRFQTTVAPPTTLVPVVDITEGLVCNFEEGCIVCGS